MKTEKRSCHYEPKIIPVVVTKETNKLQISFGDVVNMKNKDSVVIIINSIIKYTVVAQEFSISVVVTLN